MRPEDMANGKRPGRPEDAAPIRPRGRPKNWDRDASLFDSWALIQLQIVDLGHAANLLRKNGKEAAARDVDELISAKRIEGQRIQRIRGLVP